MRRWSLLIFRSVGQRSSLFLICWGWGINVLQTSIFYVAACDVPADIVFLVDESRRVGLHNFPLQTQLIVDSISGFKIGAKTTRFGLVTFYSEVVAEFYLNSYHDMKTLTTKIRTIAFNHSGFTKTEKGLGFVREIMFSSHHGGRGDMQHIIMLIKDGKSSNS